MEQMDIRQNQKIEELLDKIRREHGNYTSAQALVANYIINNYYQIPFLSITSLARNIGVSNGCIINFCKLLGYSRFTEFKKEFSKLARAELIMSNKLMSSSLPDSGENDFMQTGMLEDYASIEATLTNPSNKSALQNFLPLIDKANYIYVVGGRSSAVLASLFASMLRYLDLKVMEVDLGSSSYPDRIAMIGEKDLVIAISLPRYTSNCISALNILHDRGTAIALITDLGLSPACEYADIVFRCAVTSDFYFPCVSGCISLINVLCRAIASSRKGSAASHICQLEQLLIDEGIFI